MSSLPSLSSAAKRNATLGVRSKEAQPSAVGQALSAWWQSLAARERRLLSLGALVLALALLWTLGIAPAVKTLRTAPAQLERAEANLQRMNQLASQARELRGATPVAPEQAQAALKAATNRLGDKARLSFQGDRAVLTLAGVGASALRDWLAEARSGARARPVEANLQRGPQGLTGTVVLVLGGVA